MMRIKTHSGTTTSDGGVVDTSTTPGTTTPGKKPLKKRIKQLFQRSSSSASSFSRISNTSNTSTSYNRPYRRTRRNSFSSLMTEKSIKSLGTIDLNHSNSLLDDGDEEGLGMYALEDIEKFHNCGGSSCLSLLLLVSSTTTQDHDGNGKSGESEDNVDDHGRIMMPSQESIPEDYDNGQQQNEDSVLSTTNDSSSTITTTTHGQKQRQDHSSGNSLSLDKKTHHNKTFMDNNPLHDNNEAKKFPSTTSLLSENEVLYHQLSELYQEGQKLLEHGWYDKAWDIQKKALACISSYRIMSTMGTATIPQDKRQEKDAEVASFCARQEATIRYELAKIKYLHARESSHDRYDDANYQGYVSRLDELVENARCKVALCNYEYYTAQLRAVEESQDCSDMNQIYNKLYIVHNLGSLCEKDLHRYEEALVFYQHALDIEERVLRAYRDRAAALVAGGGRGRGRGGGGKASSEVLEKDLMDDGQEKKKEREGGQERGRKEHCHEDDDNIADIDFHVNDFVQRIRYTKRKIGRIQHTGMGRFDLALLSSVST
eukprot:CAMPEP_0176503724 /NCGR_PEP_ID=MMETSP0200_2-20121128/15528_1 /TAXON_ID=947934 /ORGANISM="Chaetoceros sp., Strain GSL56" /LENGTH=542 /DNA_ID=CAMNT_0017903059 /DNA_START=621 /DNA_END=2249 /DNA_ORIENTATION=+